MRQRRARGGGPARAGNDSGAQAKREGAWQRAQRQARARRGRRPERFKSKDCCGAAEWGVQRGVVLQHAGYVWRGGGFSCGGRGATGSAQQVQPGGRRQGARAATARVARRDGGPAGGSEMLRNARACACNGNGTQWRRPLAGSRQGRIWVAGAYRRGPDCRRGLKRLFHWPMPRRGRLLEGGGSCMNGRAVCRRACGWVSAHAAGRPWRPAAGARHSRGEPPPPALAGGIQGRSAVKKSKTLRAHGLGAD
jgi:hypothetical protein